MWPARGRASGHAIPQTSRAPSARRSDAQVLIGRTLGHYRVTAALGAGGMGEVYRATDLTLERDVAIKVLPPDVARNADRIARFRREARVLASLNHPNIAAIYGFEEVDGLAFLLLELVDGEDLAERLRRGPLPLREALDVARQIAEALEAAHERGIVHRDLKPANVKVTAGGTVKVLDFGLAKAWAADDVSGITAPAVSVSPTVAPGDTAAGVMIGTAAYMPPEQARGRAVDRRADIWAFGVVLYEMLTGRRLFAGETLTDVIAAVVMLEPDLSQLPPDSPPAIRRLLRRCLKKEPRLRLPDIGSARLELTELLSGIVERDEGADRYGSRRRFVFRPWMAAAVVAVLAVAALAAFVLGRQTAPVAAARPAIRTSLELTQGVRVGAYAVPLLSPDGRYVVIAGAEPRQSQQLWLRRMDGLTFEPIAGTEGAEYAFWSPDSRSLGFLAGAVVKRVAIDGSRLQTLARLDTPISAGGAWSENGTIVVAKGVRGQTDATGATLVTLPAAGGPLTPLTTLDAGRGETGHYWPRFTDDGRYLVFVVNSSNAEHRGVFIAPPSSPGERRRLVPDRSIVSFAAGHMLFVRGQTLLAQRLDGSTGQPAGEAYAVAEGVEMWNDAGLGVFSASRDGLVVYRPARPRETQLAWVDRNGQRLGTIGEPQLYGQLALSPEGTHAAVELPDAAGRYDIWIVELTRGVPSRLTFDPADDRDPVWSPDGSRVAFTSARTSPQALFMKQAIGSGPESLVREGPADLYPESWSRDGRLFFQSSGRLSEGRTGWMWTVNGGEPAPILKTGFRVDELQVSPDGTLLAYASAESGRYEVYLEPLTGPREKIRVSMNGGGQPKWRGDGRELYFVSAGRLMVAEIAAGSGLRVGIPSPLFDLEDGSEELDYYAPDRTGRRFLVRVPPDHARAPSVHVVLNWARDGR
jgi:Tol biopolymer transport system component